MRFARGGNIALPDALRLEAGVGKPSRVAPGAPSTWPFGGDVIPITNGAGAVFMPRVVGKGVLDPDRAYVYLKSTAAVTPPTPCVLTNSSSDAWLGANNTFLGGVPFGACYELDPRLSEIEFVKSCNASAWANVSAGVMGWDVIKGDHTSGRDVPCCQLLASTSACNFDQNQWAGSVSGPVQPASPNDLTWMLPLRWVGRALTAATITPDGVVHGPALTVKNRTLSLVATPGWPVRIIAT